MRSLRTAVFFLTLFFSIANLTAQHSVARQWNEVLLEAIRNDFARPTVHARNLFHASVLMYDAWAIYHPSASPYFVGRDFGGIRCEWGQIAAVSDIQAAQEEAMSYAVYRLLKYRFEDSPGAVESQQHFDDLMVALGYDHTEVSTDHLNGPPAAVGNYLAECIIQFGHVDGSNEDNSYSNKYYQPVNPPMVIFDPGNPNIVDLNRWQPLTLDVFIDQAGNPIPFNTPEFLSPEWGSVVPFALTDDDLNTYQRDGNDYLVYHDPGAPPNLNITDGSGSSDQYRWGFSLVSVWSSHLDPADGITLDISPASIGNINQLPSSDLEQQQFYQLLEGGDASIGHQQNPATGQPYQAQIVPRADYARVLAEFWADGPDSETPPGHWFVILNFVNDHPLLEKRFKGAGPIISDLEWDVKAYFALGGAMHDAAISAWGIKGWYDYIRPVSALRGMAELGQGSDANLSSYHPGGINLIPGYIELVEAGDPLAGSSNEHVGKIKLFSWRGPGFISNPETDVAGVDWILAEHWWPYQRPSFVTPPFAGYISGHSTYSRAAAEVLTLLTGDPFFPGGMGEFVAKQNEFLVFEDGPSVDITLQWATYRDASDQTSLSRIWGGIHPPADDIPGRQIGIQIGINAFEKAELYFDGLVTNVDEENTRWGVNTYPNPVDIGGTLYFSSPTLTEKSLLRLLSIDGGVVWERSVSGGQLINLEIPTSAFKPGLYLLHLGNSKIQWSQKILLQKN